MKLSISILYRAVIFFEIFKESELNDEKSFIQMIEFSFAKSRFFIRTSTALNFAKTEVFKNLTIHSQDEKIPGNKKCISKHVFSIGPEI